MKYDLIQTNLSVETVIDNEKYSVDITMAIHPVDNIAPNFTKTVTVTSNNSQTGYEVDAQREAAVEEFMNQINA